MHNKTTRKYKTSNEKPPYFSKPKTSFDSSSTMGFLKECFHKEMPKVG